MVPQPVGQELLVCHESDADEMKLAGDNMRRGRMKVSSSKRLAYASVVLRWKSPLASHSQLLQTKGSPYQPCQSAVFIGEAKMWSKFSFATMQFQSSPS